MQATYRRGQVEWALWRLKAPKTKEAPPSQFLTRIKRLLEIDRAGARPKPSGPRFAFSDTASPGKGEEAQFSPLDALCLWLALELLELGFKQQEVVAAIRSVRLLLARGLRGALEGGGDQVATLLMLPRVEPSGQSRAGGPRLIAPDDLVRMAREGSLAKTVLLTAGLAATDLAETLPMAPALRRGRPAAD